jgi:hypothetical protein
VTTVWIALMIETAAALAGLAALAAWARRRFRPDFDRDFDREFGRAFDREFEREFGPASGVEPARELSRD